MRHLLNALIWLFLTVGLPVMLYATTMIQDHEEPEPSAPRHGLRALSAYRDTRGAAVARLHVEVDDLTSSPDDEPTP